MLTSSVNIFSRFWYVWLVMVIVVVEKNAAVLSNSGIFVIFFCLRMVSVAIFSSYFSREHPSILNKLATAS